MKPSIHHILPLGMTILASLGFSASPARAALEITRDDITETGGVFTYNYSFTYADMLQMATGAGQDHTQTAVILTTGGKFFDDIFSASGTIRLMIEKTGDAFIQYNGRVTPPANASFTYKFDFTDAGYEIASFTVKDLLYAANQSRAVLTQYSTDGTTWTDANGQFTNILRTTTSITGGNTFSSGTSSVLTLASGVSTLYYRVVFTSLTTDPADFYSQQTWNRLNASNNSGFFDVNITLTPAPAAPGPAIPEPVTAAMLTGATALAFILLRRHSRN